MARAGSPTSAAISAMMGAVLIVAILPSRPRWVNGQPFDDHRSDPCYRSATPDGRVNLLSSLSGSRLVCDARGMSSLSSNRYKHHRFPAEIISHAVWLYFRFCLSYRDVEELLFARDIIVAYETIRKWAENSDKRMPISSDADALSRVTSSIWMKCSSRSMGNAIISGGPSIKMGPCSISSCNAGGTSTRPRRSSARSSRDAGTFHRSSSGCTEQRYRLVAGQPDSLEKTPSTPPSLLGAPSRPYCPAYVDDGVASTAILAVGSEYTPVTRPLLPLLTRLSTRVFPATSD